MGTCNDTSFRLPVLGEVDVDAELKKFEDEERARLGLKIETCLLYTSPSPRD